MKKYNRITEAEARRLQRNLDEFGHKIQLEFLTDRATELQEGEEPAAVALSAAQYDKGGQEIPEDARFKAEAALLMYLCFFFNFDPALLLDASTEAGNASLANGYAPNGARDTKKGGFCWLFFPLNK